LLFLPTSVWAAEGAFESPVLDVAQAPAFEIVEAIEILLIVRDFDVVAVVGEVERGLKEDGAAILDELAQRMQGRS
jgi:hypothetical protein